MEEQDLSLVHEIFEVIDLNLNLVDIILFIKHITNKFPLIRLFWNIASIETAHLYRYTGNM